MFGSETFCSIPEQWCQESWKLSSRRKGKFKIFQIILLISFEFLQENRNEEPKQKKQHSASPTTKPEKQKIQKVQKNSNSQNLPSEDYSDIISSLTSRIDTLEQQNEILSQVGFPNFDFSL